MDMLKQQKSLGQWLNGIHSEVEMPIDFSKKQDKSPKNKAVRQTTEWRPPVGTRVFIKKHHAWGNRTGTVVAHGKWMGLKTLEVEVDGTRGQRAGITDPDQIMVVINE